MWNKKILVTGGAGFIGSNLIEALLEKEATVVCLDNLSTGKYENIKEFETNKRFIFVNGDIRDSSILNKILPETQIIFHQAALGSVPRSIKNPITTIDNNITGSANVFFLAQKHNVKRVVYASSSSVYGDNNTLPKIEAKIGKPLSPYAITKLACEILAENFNSLYGTDFIGLRYFNVFGKKQDPNSMYAAVIPKFVKQLMSHQPPHINGDGSFSRDFTYIKNVIQANLKAASTTNVEALNKAYNVAFGERTDLNQLVEILKKELSQFDSKINNINSEFGSVREGDIPHSLANIDLIKTNLNYQPKYTIEQGIHEAVKWYWHNL